MNMRAPRNRAYGALLSAMSEMLNPAVRAVALNLSLIHILMRKAFSQRRKQLKKQLPASPPWEGVAASLGLSPSARAEELNLSQWVELARVYDTNPLKDVAQSGDELFDIVDELNQVCLLYTSRCV